MTEKELIHLAEDAQFDRQGKSIYEIELYGCGKEIRRRAGYPMFLPLRVHAVHSVFLNSTPNIHDLSTQAPFMLCYSSIYKENWNRVSNVPCEQIVSPFVSFRRHAKIEQSANAKGTLFFPMHSALTIDVELDIELLIEELKSIPSKYQPVEICLHHVDIKKGLHEPFLDAGFTCHTAGHGANYKFIPRFYDLLKKYKYSASNSIGGYTFYSVEMNIPFFIYGVAGKLINKSNTAYSSFGDITEEINKWSLYLKAKELFSVQTEQITYEQKKFVEEMLGVGEGISNLHLTIILYLAYIKDILSKIFSHIKLMGKFLLKK